MNSVFSNKLNEIEAEMKRIGYWQEKPSDSQASVASREWKSYLDAPSFEIWLQTVFLPNARLSVQTNNLPSDSQVGVIAMRQYDYHSVVLEAHGLMRLLCEFDKLVASHEKSR